MRRGPSEMLHETLGSVQVTVEHDDPLEAFADEAVHHGAATAASPQDHGLAGHLLATDELVQRDLEAGHVRVVADESLALAGERVDGAGEGRLLREAIDHRHDSLLVRDRDVGAEEVVAPQLPDGVGKPDRGAIPKLVLRVDTELVEGGLLHGTRE